MLRVVAGLLVCAVPWCTSPGQAHARPESRVVVREVGGGTILVRDVTGGYQRHPEVFADLLRQRDRRYVGIGDCFGVYPTDPDALRPNQTLRWRVGVRVAPQKAGAALPAAPRGYVLERLPAEQAAVLETDVQRAALDGLSIIRWMVENGYVQTGPTRMEYTTHEGNPMLIPVRIIVPVKVRPSGLKLPAVSN